MTYDELLAELKGCAEPEFAAFQKKLIPTKQKILGVRTPKMREIAKRLSATLDELFAFPDEYYEVTFIKLCKASALPYEEFVKHVEHCVALMDNWATCDCFKPKCIQKHLGEFVPKLERIFARGGEFDERFVLVTLLGEYLSKEYFPIVESFSKRANTDYYNVHMAKAWLIAEALVKDYEFGLELLMSEKTDIKTKNKAIQKARESYRITEEQKQYLLSLKEKSKK